LPNLTHYELFMAPAMAATALAFLDNTSKPPSWDQQVWGR